MSSTKKRIRVFAGPNGSGKTTIMTDLRNRIPFGVYVNADDIEKELHDTGSVDLSQYSLVATTLEIQHYFRKSQFAPLKLNIPDLFSHISIFQRRIMGAGLAQIIPLITGNFVLLFWLSCLIAFPVAYIFMDKWLKLFSYNTGLTIFPFLFSTVAVLFIVLLTVIFHVIKAATANPVKSLRTEG